MLLVNYPLEPSQISLISMFTIGIPAFFMSLEPNTDRINGRFLSNVLFKALPGGLTDFLVVSCLYTFCMEFNVNETDYVSTSCTVILAIVGLMILFKIASPMNRFHWILWFEYDGRTCLLHHLCAKDLCNHKHLKAEHDAASCVCRCD